MPAYQATIGLLRPAGVVKAGKLVEFMTGDPAIETLIDVRAITPVNDVMLKEIPGWFQRADVLASVGIYNINDFLSASLETDAEALKMSVRELADWRKLLMDGWPVGAVPPCNC